MPAFHFYLSSSYLCRIFKDSTGTTINQYITAKRISRAKVLLAEGHPVAEDSSLCGFGDYSNFLPAKSGQKDGSSKGFQEENENYRNLAQYVMDWKGTLGAIPMSDCRDQVYRLMLTTNRCIGIYYEIAKKMGIKENTLLLDILSDKKQHSQKQICDDWHIPRTTLNTIIKECVKSGYMVLLTQNSTKEKLISLTNSGQIFTDKVTGEMKEAVQRAIEKIQREYSTDFIMVFEKYVEYLEHEYKNH